MCVYVYVHIHICVFIILPLSRPLDHNRGTDVFKSVVVRWRSLQPRQSEGCVICCLSYKFMLWLLCMSVRNLTLRGVRQAQVQHADARPLGRSGAHARSRAT